MIVDARGTLNCIGLGPNFVKKEQGVGRMSPACLTGARRVGASRKYGYRYPPFPTCFACILIDVSQLNVRPTGPPHPIKAACDCMLRNWLRAMAKA